MPWLASMPWPRRYIALFTVPLMRCSCPVPLAEKQPHSITFPPPCLKVGMVFLGSQAAFLLLQTPWAELMPKSLILVSSDHNTFTQFSTESLANFRRACTCAFLSRETLRALQDFSPSRRSVLPFVFLVTMVPAALRLTRSSRVALGWFLTVLMIIETPRGEILHGAPVRGRLTVIMWSQITVFTFSPSCLTMVLKPIPALCRSTILSLTSLDSSLVLAKVESLESDWLIASVDRWDCL